MEVAAGHEVELAFERRLFRGGRSRRSLFGPSFLTGPVETRLRGRRVRLTSGSGEAVQKVRESAPPSVLRMAAAVITAKRPRSVWLPPGSALADRACCALIQRRLRLNSKRASGGPRSDAAGHKGQKEDSHWKSPAVR